MRAYGRPCWSTGEMRACLYARTDFDFKNDTVPTIVEYALENFNETEVEDE